MARKIGKLHVVGGRNETEDEVDVLFKLPLSEFTAARNTLAARLKKDGRGDAANEVKALAKPPISAWTVNQLYWSHRAEFDRLIDSGVRFHKAQSSSSAGKLTDMRFALEARRESLAQLSDFATSLLEAAGHNPTPDTIHRITTTLEAMSVYASRADAPPPGRLSGDVDPPGFESLGAFTPGVSVTAKPSKASPSQKSGAQPKTKLAHDARQIEATRKARIAAAKASLQEAKNDLTEARDKEKRLLAAHKKVEAEARSAEKLLQKAQAASEAAIQRLRRVAVEVKEASRRLETAVRTVAEASEELEKLFAESPAK